ncbi:MAG: hypothetical protein MPN21_09580 [Thermoanaerobaculia bacterium]|nr:hypothetical protein [Thermoanaerobaculia bacterium]
MAPQTTPLTVRVQARGGKFLADDIGGATISIRDVRSGDVLASGVTRGTSGSLKTTDELEPGDLARASLCVVRTPGDPETIRWLIADSDSSKFVADLEIEGPTQVEVVSYGSLGGLQSAQQVTATTWLAPGAAGPTEPGFVLEIPGLVVQVQQPATHSALAAVPTTVPLEVNVAMMCGCPIDDGEPWIPDDFRVTAAVGVVGGQSLETVPLAFDQSAGIAGRFTGCYRVTTPGFYEAQFVAEQVSTGNTGSGLVTFFFESSS